MAARWDYIEYLVSRGAFLNVKDAYGRTPLHAAVSGGPRCVRAAVALIKRGADLLASDHRGTTPLDALCCSDERMSALVSAAIEAVIVATKRAAEEAMVFKAAAEAGKAAAERAAAEALAGKAAAEAAVTAALCLFERKYRYCSGVDRSRCRHLLQEQRWTDVRPFLTLHSRKSV